MELHVNGQSRQWPAAPTIERLLEAEGQAGRRVAVEVNREIVPRSQHATHALRDGDRVEIIHAIGGG